MNIVFPNMSLLTNTIELDSAPPPPKNLPNKLVRQDTRTLYMLCGGDHHMGIRGLMYAIGELSLEVAVWVEEGGEVIFSIINLSLFPVYHGYLFPSVCLAGVEAEEG
jgi:hypothetical protein